MPIRSATFCAARDATSEAFLWGLSQSLRAGCARQPPSPREASPRWRRSTGARSGTRGIALLLEQGFEQAPQLAVTGRLPTLVQVVGKVQLGRAALSNIGAAHVDVGPAMLDVETLAVGVEHEMPLVLVIQDGASGGPVQLSFQQSHGHLLLVCVGSPGQRIVMEGRVFVE